MYLGKFVCSKEHYITTLQPRHPCDFSMKTLESYLLIALGGKMSE